MPNVTPHVGRDDLFVDVVDELARLATRPVICGACLPSAGSIAGREGMLDRWSAGRQHLISRLVDDGIWNARKPHHLLGAALAREFATYAPVASELNIRSLDTSNPVVAGLLGHTYNGDFGLSIKPSTLLADLIEAQPDEDAVERILYNTSQFKRIIKRRYW